MGFKVMRIMKNECCKIKRRRLLDLNIGLHGTIFQILKIFVCNEFLGFRNEKRLRYTSYMT